MTNPFSGRAVPVSGPATDILPVTPADGADLPKPAIALYVESGGALVIDTPGGVSRTVAVSDAMILPVACSRVRATGTTATGIHALVIG